MSRPWSVESLPLWLHQTAHRLNAICLGAVVAVLIWFLVGGELLSRQLAGVAIGQAAIYLGAWLVYLVRGNAESHAGS